MILTIIKLFKTKIEILSIVYTNLKLFNSDDNKNRNK